MELPILTLNLTFLGAGGFQLPNGESLTHYSTIVFETPDKQILTLTVYRFDLKIRVIIDPNHLMI